MSSKGMLEGQDLHQVKKKKVNELRKKLSSVHDVKAASKSMLGNMQPPPVTTHTYDILEWGLLQGSHIS